MTANVSPQKMEAYARTARVRAQQREQRLDERRKRAWTVVRRAATLLKDTYGADGVVVFGSLLTPRLFHERSDVDLAVWGLDERRYLRALAALLDLDPDIEFDLIEAEHARTGLLRVLAREGQAA